MWQYLKILIKFCVFHILLSNHYIEPILSSDIVWDTLSENAKFKYKQVNFSFLLCQGNFKVLKNASCYSSSKNRNEIIRSQLMTPFSEGKKKDECNWNVYCHWNSSSLDSKYGFDAGYYDNLNYRKCPPFFYQVFLPKDHFEPPKICVHKLPITTINISLPVLFRNAPI